MGKSNARRPKGSMNKPEKVIFSIQTSKADFEALQEAAEYSTSGSSLMTCRKIAKRR